MPGETVTGRLESEIKSYIINAKSSFTGVLYIMAYFSPKQDLIDLVGEPLKNSTT